MSQRFSLRDADVWRLREREHDATLSKDASRLRSRFVSLSPTEILVVLVVGFLVLGPERLPAVARRVGSWWQQLNDVVRDARDEFYDGSRSGASDAKSSVDERDRVPTRGSLDGFRPIVDAREPEGHGRETLERDDPARSTP